MMEVNIFEELFLKTTFWGYLGPMALVIGGYLLSKKDRNLGVLWFVMELLFIAQYMGMIAATPQYWWHIFILLFGGIFTCVFPFLDR